MTILKIGLLGIYRKLNLLITCLTLASDDLDFENCKYNIKNGMAPLHSYRNGELIPFL